MYMFLFLFWKVNKPIYGFSSGWILKYILSGVNLLNVVSQEAPLWLAPTVQENVQIYGLAKKYLKNLFH